MRGLGVPLRRQCVYLGIARRLVNLVYSSELGRKAAAENQRRNEGLGHIPPKSRQWSAVVAGENEVEGKREKKIEEQESPQKHRSRKREGVKNMFFHLDGEQLP